MDEEEEDPVLQEGKQQEDEKRMQEAIKLLSTRFDSVQIFVTRYDGGDQTVAYNDGTGNWYSRLGQVAAWVDAKMTDED